MKTNAAIAAALFAAALLMAACTPAASARGEEKADGGTEAGHEEKSAEHFPEQLAEIPEGYWEEAEQQGTLQDLYYDTYEAFSYEEKGQTLRKHAIVYLPYGYEESERYPVLYLMHGGWSDETAYLGSTDAPARMKHVLDHGIAEGEIRPMIVVCPTYNNTSPEDSGDYGLALRLTDLY